MVDNAALDEFRVLKSKVSALELDNVRLVERGKQLAESLKAILETEQVGSVDELDRKYHALEMELAEQKAQWEQLVATVTSEIGAQ